MSGPGLEELKLEVAQPFYQGVVEHRSGGSGAEYTYISDVSAIRVLLFGPALPSTSATLGTTCAFVSGLLAFWTSMGGCPAHESSRCHQVLRAVNLGP